MTAQTLASSRRRTTVFAVALALVIGTAALAVANGKGGPAADAVPVATASPTPLPLPAAMPATDAVDATDVIASSPVENADGPEVVAADAESASVAAEDDPLADVFLVAVDPADALLADNGADAVSD